MGKNMTTLAKILGRFILCLSLPAGGWASDRKPAISEVYAYRYISTGSMIALDTQENAIFIDDVGFTAYFCNDESNYYCIDEEIFHFAVPKNFSAATKSWRLNGHDYRIETPLSLRDIFGQQFFMSVIVSSKMIGTRTIQLRYYYSPEHGLSGFELEQANGSNGNLLSTGETGFGAQSAQQRE